MSNVMFRQKMITALEAMQKSCSDMCDILKDEAGRNMELLQSDTEVAPARRMWKRWAIEKEDGECGEVLWTRQERALKYGLDANPVTILPGHDAVERIERKAYERGYRDCHHKMSLDERGPYERERIEMEAYERDRRDALTIDGVEPIVVDGWTHDDYADSRTMPPYPWTEELGSRRLVVSAWRRQDGACNTPCRVHIYPGIWPDGKRVTPQEGES